MCIRDRIYRGEQSLRDLCRRRPQKLAQQDPGQSRITPGSQKKGMGVAGRHQPGHAIEREARAYKHAVLRRGSACGPSATPISSITTERPAERSGRKDMKPVIEINDTPGTTVITFDGGGTVSYTPLDVYKRQLLNNHGCFLSTLFF